MTNHTTPFTTQMVSKIPSSSDVDALTERLDTALEVGDIKEAANQLRIFKSKYKIPTDHGGNSTLFRRNHLKKMGLLDDDTLDD